MNIQCLRCQKKTLEPLSGIKDKDGCELPCRWGELNLGYLGEHLELFITEQSLQLLSCLLERQYLSG